MQENQHIEWKDSWRDEYLKWIFVANTLYLAGMIEAWGRGIERIMQECAAAGVPAPELRYEQTGLWTVFHFLAEHVLGATTPKAPVETLVEKTVKTSERILGLLWGQSGKVAQAWPLGGVAMSIIGNAERETQNSVTSCDGERLNEYILT